MKRRFCFRCLSIAPQLSGRGKFEETDGKSYQIMTAAADGQVLVWDMRFEEKAIAAGAGHARRNSLSNPDGIAGAAPSSSSSMEIHWNPLYKVVLRGSGQGKCGISKFALNMAVGGQCTVCVLGY